MHNSKRVRTSAALVRSIISAEKVWIGYVSASLELTETFNKFILEIIGVAGFKGKAIRASRSQHRCEASAHRLDFVSDTQEPVQCAKAELDVEIRESNLEAVVK